MIDVEQIAKKNLDEARNQYVQIMEHIAKYARADMESVRDGSFPDQHAATVLALGIAAYNCCLGADAVLKSVCGDRTALRPAQERSGP